MDNFKLITPLLTKHNKTQTELIEYLCDERRNHELWKYSGNVMIRLENGNKSKRMFIDKRLLNIVDKFLNE